MDAVQFFAFIGIILCKRLLNDLPNVALLNQGLTAFREETNDAHEVTDDIVVNSRIKACHKF